MIPWTWPSSKKTEFSIKYYGHPLIEQDSKQWAMSIEYHDENETNVNWILDCGQLVICYYFECMTLLFSDNR